MKKKFSLICLLLILAGCKNECDDPNRPWDYFDYCQNIPGTKEYKRVRPAPCPWPLLKNKCEPPK